MSRNDPPRLKNTGTNPTDAAPTDNQIDPLVCPRGHHSVKLTAQRFSCDTCRRQGRDETAWPKTELVDLREEEPPLVDDDQDDSDDPELIADGGTEEIPVRVGPADHTAPANRLDAALKQLALAREDERAAGISRELGTIIADIRELRAVVDADDDQDDSDDPELIADGGRPTKQCYDCERELPARDLLHHEIVETYDEGLGYDEVRVPLCRGCAVERFGERCEKCGEEFLTVTEYNQHYAREHVEDRRPMTDGGRTIPLQVGVYDQRTAERFRAVEQLVAAELDVEPDDLARWEVVRELVEAYSGGDACGEWRQDDQEDEEEPPLVADGGSKYVRETGDGYLGIWTTTGHTLEVAIGVFDLGWRTEDTVLVVDDDEPGLLLTQTHRHPESVTEANVQKGGVGRNVKVPASAIRRLDGHQAGADVRGYEDPDGIRLVPAAADPFVGGRS